MRLLYADELVRSRMSDRRAEAEAASRAARIVAARRWRRLARLANDRADAVEATR